jgi:hypothetical protein
MTTAQVLHVADNVDDKVTGVDNKMNEVIDSVLGTF